MRFRGTLRLALAFAALLGSLSLVVWRQSRALEVLGELEALRTARAMLESERSALKGRIQHLESRARIMDVAAARWGMRVPASGEVIVLKLRPQPSPGTASPLRVVMVDVGREEGGD